MSTDHASNSHQDGGAEEVSQMDDFSSVDFSMTEFNIKDGITDSISSGDNFSSTAQFSKVTGGKNASAVPSSDCVDGKINDKLSAGNNTDNLKGGNGDNDNVKVQGERSQSQGQRVCHGDGTTCVECGKSFSHAFYFSTHITCHMTEKSYTPVGQCGICGTVFANVAVYQAHMNSLQSREKAKPEKQQVKKHKQQQPPKQHQQPRQQQQQHHQQQHQKHTVHGDKGVQKQEIKDEDGIKTPKHEAILRPTESIQKWQKGSLEAGTKVETSLEGTRTKPCGYARAERPKQEVKQPEREIASEKAVLKRAASSEPPAENSDNGELPKKRVRRAPVKYECLPEVKRVRGAGRRKSLTSTAPSFPLPHRRVMSDSSYLPEYDPEVERYLQSLKDMGLTVDPDAFGVRSGAAGVRSGAAGVRSGAAGGSSVAGGGSSGARGGNSGAGGGSGGAGGVGARGRGSFGIRGGGGGVRGSISGRPFDIGVGQVSRGRGSAGPRQFIDPFRKGPSNHNHKNQLTSPPSNRHFHPHQQPQQQQHHMMAKVRYEGGNSASAIRRVPHDNRPLLHDRKKFRTDDADVFIHSPQTQKAGLPQPSMSLGHHSGGHFGRKPSFENQQKQQQQQQHRRHPAIDKEKLPPNVAAMRRKFLREQEDLEIAAVLAAELEVMPKSGKQTRGERLKQRHDRLSLNGEEVEGAEGGSVAKRPKIQYNAPKEKEERSRRGRGSHSLRGGRGQRRRSANARRTSCGALTTGGVSLDVEEDKEGGVMPGLSGHSNYIGDDDDNNNDDDDDDDDVQIMDIENSSVASTSKKSLISSTSSKDERLERSSSSKSVDQIDAESLDVVGEVTNVEGKMERLREEARKKVEAMIASPDAIFSNVDMESQRDDGDDGDLSTDVVVPILSTLEYCGGGDGDGVGEKVGEEEDVGDWTVEERNEDNEVREGKEVKKHVGKDGSVTADHGRSKDGRSSLERSERVEGGDGEDEEDIEEGEDIAGWKVSISNVSESEEEEEDGGKDEEGVVNGKKEKNEVGKIGGSDCVGDVVDDKNNKEEGGDGWKEEEEMETEGKDDDEERDRMKGSEESKESCDDVGKCDSPMNEEEGRKEEEKGKSENEEGKGGGGEDGWTEGKKAEGEGGRVENPEPEEDGEDGGDGSGNIGVKKTDNEEEENRVDDGVEKKEVVGNEDNYASKKIEEEEEGEQGKGKRAEEEQNELEMKE